MTSLPPPASVASYLARHNGDLAAAYREFNDERSPAESTEERIRTHLRQARNDLDRCAMYTQSPSVAALHSAVRSLVAAIEARAA